MHNASIHMNLIWRVRTNCIASWNVLGKVDTGMWSQNCWYEACRRRAGKDDPQQWLSVIYFAFGSIIWLSCRRIKAFPCSRLTSSNLVGSLRSCAMFVCDGLRILQLVWDFIQLKAHSRICRTTDGVGSVVLDSTVSTSSRYPVALSHPARPRKLTHLSLVGHQCQ
jgi:hypothetical protein